MGLMDILAAAQGGAFFANAGEAAGLSGEAARGAFALLAPAIAEKLKARAQDEAAFDALLDLLEDGDGDAFLDDPALLRDKEVTADGKAILKDLYGTQAKAAAAGVALTRLPKAQVDRLMPLAAAGVLAALARANGSSGQQFLGSEGSSGGLLGSIVKAVVEGAVKEVSRQLAPKRRRRRYTGYSSYRRKRRKTTTRRTRRPSLESIFRDILSGR